MFVSLQSAEMASSKDATKIERLRERLLLCTICMDEYKDPRILPCHHSICLECLVEYVRLSTATGYFFRCPQCRAEIAVPSGGLKDFPPNFFVSSLMDEIGTKPYSSSCEICDRNWLAAQFRCIDCDKDICRFCIPEHKLFEHNASRTPGIIRIETAPASELLTSHKSCLKHGEPPNVYCEQCKEILCLSCVCEFHKSHKTMSLAQRLLSVEKELKEERQQVAEELQNIENDLENLDEFAEKVCQRYGAIRKQIDNQADVLHRVIEQRSAAQIKKVDDVEQEFLNQVEMCRERYGQYHKQVSNASDFLSDIQHEDLTLELMTEYNKYKSLVTSTKKSISKKVKYSEMSFLKGTWTLFWGFFIFSFGLTKKHFFRNSYKFRPTFPNAENTSKQSWHYFSKRCFNIGPRFKKVIPTIPCPKWLSSAMALSYVAMVTVLMLITLLYLGYQYFALESESCYSADTLTGFLFCSFLFLVFAATVKKSYWKNCRVIWTGHPLQN